MTRTRKFFITGTGTGVGKTFATACLADFFVRRGLKTAVTKPLQTGIDEGDDDVAEIKKAVPYLLQLPSSLENVYRFKLPASPDLAARNENSSIDIFKIVSAVSAIERSFAPDVLLVEGAGGLYVPVYNLVMIIDLLKLLTMPAVVVCDAGLGTINHSLLTIRALQSKNIDCAGFIVNRLSDSPGIVEKDNIETLKELAGVPFLGTIKKISSMSEISPDVYSFPGLA